MMDGRSVVSNLLCEVYKVVLINPLDVTFPREEAAPARAIYHRKYFVNSDITLVPQDQRSDLN